MADIYKSSVLAVLAVFLLASHSTGQQDDLFKVGSIDEFRQREAPKPEGFKMVISVRAQEAVKLNLVETECWMSYLFKRRAFRVENRLDEKFETGQVLVPAFEEEYLSRLELRDKLNENQAKLGKSQKEYLAVLNRIHDAGFFADYVFKYHHQKAWDEYAGEVVLQADKFAEWAQKSLVGHQAPDFCSLMAQPENLANAPGVLIEKNNIKAAEGAVWLRYAFHRLEYLRAQAAPLKVLVDEEILPGFEEELNARRKILEENWDKTQQALGETTLQSFLAMKNADDAGFGKEFVWKFCKQPDWEQPKRLRLEEFEKWAMENIPDHPDKAPAHAVLYGRQNKPGR